MAISKSLGSYIVDRTESLNIESIKKYFIEHNMDRVHRLLDSEQYILEGSRGIGKTMLMKYAELLATESFAQESVLAVWISFEEAIRIERIKNLNQSLDPFLQWTMGKMLYEVLKKIIELRPSYLDELKTRIATIFNAQPQQDSINKYITLLEEYIFVLEKGEVETNEELVDKTPSDELTKILDNPTSFKEFLVKLCEEFNLTRIVLLFDEAAHVFSHNQQEKFFTLFKGLRHPRIACKAAVYPGITNYGKYFEKGQDAKEIRLDWSLTSTQDVNYIKNILKTRIKEYNEDYWYKLTVNPEVIETICICSNGNPRFAFHIIDELDTSGAFTKKTITLTNTINSIRKVFDNKWREFNTLKQRLPQYSCYIERAEYLVKEHLVKNIKDWNEKRRKEQRKMSSGIYIDVNAYDKIPKVFDILAYYNIVTIDYSKKSLGHGNYGYYIGFNPSILFSDAILKNVKEISDVSIAIENNQAYSQATKEIAEIISTAVERSQYSCSNEKCDYTTSQEYRFCPMCGSEISNEEQKPLYKILRAHGIENLRLGTALKNRLKGKFTNIGEIYDAPLEEIRMEYIQDVRIEVVKNAAIEYMAG